MEIEKSTNTGEGEADFFIDITDEVCPLTFVKTKLLIERMASGQTAEVRLRAAHGVSFITGLAIAGTPRD